MSTYPDNDVPVPEDKEAELLRAKEAIAGPVPLIADQPDGTVILPRGYMNHGVLQAKAEVKELTGADEEAFARVKKYTDFFDLIIALGTIRLGDLDLTEMSFPERQGVLRTLLVGERERLFLTIVQVTYGDTKTVNFTCGQCAAEQEVDIIFSEDLTVREVDDLRVSYTKRISTNDLIEYRLVNGEDQLEALKTDNMAEQNTIILSRVITKVNDGLVVDPMVYARQMKSRDRKAILDDLVDHQPGVSLEVKLTCVRCQNDQTLLLGWADLFQL